MDLEKIKEFLSTTTGKIVLASTIILAFYFIMSPYQNCKRNLPDLWQTSSSARIAMHCNKITSW
tara:strand:+ start:283 stop:474 length:192 start_codon:yes stop_codon:yes gene_type:complete